MEEDASPRVSLAREIARRGGKSRQKTSPPKSSSPPKKPPVQKSPIDSKLKVLDKIKAKVKQKGDGQGKKTKERRKSLVKPRYSLVPDGEQPIEMLLAAERASAAAHSAGDTGKNKPFGLYRQATVSLWDKSRALIERDSFVEGQLEKLQRASGVVWEVEDPSAVPFAQQGNMEMYTEEFLEKRHALRNDQRVRGTLESWWAAIQESLRRRGRSDEAVTKDTYIEIFLQVYHSLVTDYEEGEDEAACEEDWEEDLEKFNPGGDSLTKEHVFHSLFELADLWTVGCEANEYVGFLSTLLENTIRKQSVSAATVDIKPILRGGKLSVRRLSATLLPSDADSPPAEPPKPAFMRGRFKAAAITVWIGALTVTDGDRSVAEWHRGVASIRMRVASPWQVRASGGRSRRRVGCGT